VYSVNSLRNNFYKIVLILNIHKNVLKIFFFSFFFSQPPRPKPAWIGELPATKFGSPCIQYSQFPYDSTEKVEGAENCLYLNIYVPVRKKSEKKISMPVLFWIHGGAFQFGSGMIYRATYLMDSDVILVTINHRLGPMGNTITQCIMYMKLSQHFIRKDYTILPILKFICPNVL